MQGILGTESSPGSPYRHSERRHRGTKASPSVRASPPSPARRGHPALGVHPSGPPGSVPREPRTCTAARWALQKGLPHPPQHPRHPPHPRASPPRPRVPRTAAASPDPVFIHSGGISAAPAPGDPPPSALPTPMTGFTRGSPGRHSPLIPPHYRWCGPAGPAPANGRGRHHSPRRGGRAAPLGALSPRRAPWPRKGSVSFPRAAAHPVGGGTKLRYRPRSHFSQSEWRAARRPANRNAPGARMRRRSRRSGKGRGGEQDASSYWSVLTAPSATAAAFKGAPPTPPPAEALPSLTDPVRSRSPFKRRGAGVTRRYKRRRRGGCGDSGGAVRPARLRGRHGVQREEAGVGRGGLLLPRHAGEAGRGGTARRPRGGGYAGLGPGGA